jgi:RNA polymerase sigma-70 factor, ECF subfamily
LEDALVALTTVDRELLHRCLRHEVGSWNDFVDRFVGLIYHVIHFSAHQRSYPITPEEIEDVAQEVLIAIVEDDYHVLRQFRAKASLATYLTVIARRIAVSELIKRQRFKNQEKPVEREPEIGSHRQTHASLDMVEEVQQLLRKLPSKEREVVKMFYLEGRTYEEISGKLDIPVNTIGPILARSRKKLRQATDVATSKPSNPKGK